MHEVFVIASGVVVGVTAAYSYFRTRDPLGPAIVFAPMLLFLFVYTPLAVGNAAFGSHFSDSPQALELTSFVTLIGLAGFCLGLVRYMPPRVHGGQVIAVQRLTALGRKRFLGAGMLFCGVSALVIWSMIWNSGGIERLLAQRKPFLKSPVRSGYYSELTKLAYPGMILIATAWQGRGNSVGRLAGLLVAGQAPLLLATVCGRRGPMFLLVTSLAASVFIIRQKRVSLFAVLSGLVAIGAVLLLLGRYRNDILDAETLFGPVNGINAFVNADVASGNESLLSTSADTYRTSIAYITTAHRESQYFWGLRYFVQLVIRPIPRQIWPTKYDDFGFEWMKNDQGRMGFTTRQLIDAVGFDLPRGVAGGFVADLFLEFGWALPFASFAIGVLYSRLWKVSVLESGAYRYLYFLSLSMSVFLVTQSFAGWAYKLMLLGIPTWIVVRHLESTRSKHRATARPMPTF